MHLVRIRKSLNCPAIKGFGMSRHYRMRSKSNGLASGLSPPRKFENLFATDEKFICHAPNASYETPNLRLETSSSILSGRKVDIELVFLTNEWRLSALKRS